MSTASERRVLDEAGGARAMTGVMAVMVFLTVLAAALGLATFHARAALDRGLSGHLTVEVVDADSVRRVATAARLAALLRGSPDVARVAPVGDEELSRVLSPWLGSDVGDPALPVPALIDIDLAPGGDVARVAALAARAGPGVRVAPQAAWLAPVRGVVGSLGWLAGLIVLLMAGATAAVVVLAARAGLDAHRETIEVMHMLGSTDRQVARLFQRRLALDAAIGGGAGAALAIGAVLLLGDRVRDLGSELVGAARLGGADWVLLAIIPLGYVLLATGTARVAVIRTLGRRL